MSSSLLHQHHRSTSNTSDNSLKNDYQLKYMPPQHLQQHQRSSSFPLSPPTAAAGINMHSHHNSLTFPGDDSNNVMHMPFMSSTSNGGGGLSPEAFLSTSSPNLNNNNSLHSRNHSMTSPAMNNHTYQGSHHSSPLMTPNMSPFQNTISPEMMMANNNSAAAAAASMQLQFNLSPPLTITNSPELQHYAISNNSPDMQYSNVGEVYQQQQQLQFDGYEQQNPIYQFMGMENPNNLQQSYGGGEESYAFQQPMMQQGGGGPLVYHPAPAPVPARKGRAKGKKGGKLAKQLSSDSQTSWNGIANGGVGDGIGGASQFNELTGEFSGIQAGGEWATLGQDGTGAVQQVEVRQFPCEFPGCTKVFTKQTNLKSHSRIHHTERNYACPDCGASFRRSHDLKRHQRSLHSDVKPFECSRCSKRFSRMDALRRHSSRETSACFQHAHENQELLLNQEVLDFQPDFSSGYPQ